MEQLNEIDTDNEIEKNSDNFLNKIDIFKNNNILNNLIDEKTFNNFQNSFNLETERKEDLQKDCLDVINDMLKDFVEIDETFIGGKNKNRHWDKKISNSQGRN